MIENKEYHESDDYIYLTQYQVIWCTKYRFELLNDARQAKLKMVLEDTCRKYHYEIMALKITTTYVHISIDAPYTVAPCDVTRTLKGISAVGLLHGDKELRAFYQIYGVLWNRGCLISTNHDIPEETIEKYLKEQK